MANRKIDVHHHVFPPEYNAALDRLGVKHEGGGMVFPSWSAETDIEVMDKTGIRAAIAELSSPGVWVGDGSTASYLARLFNEYMAGLIAQYPGRFGAFAAVPLPDTKAALEEAVYALDTLKLDGIGVQGSNGDRFLGDPGFAELWQELDRRKTVVHVHPNVHSTSQGMVPGVPEFFFEFIADTTRTVMSLLFSGTLERYPNIRWILSHAGGAVPYLAWRLAIGDQLPPLAKHVPQGVMHYLSRLYYDTTLSTSPFAMKATMELAGPSQILFGSDHPYAPPPLIATEVALLEKLDVFDADSRQKMEEGNALELFPRFAEPAAAAPAATVAPLLVP
jgi:predicted TIM-barrel fold metal-dependent hydrolase